MIRQSIYIGGTGSWPVTLDIAKNYLRVDYDTDDDFIELLIEAACKSGQQHANVQFNSAIAGVIVARQYDDTERYNRSELNEIELPYPNSTVVINEVKVDGATLTASDYTLRPGNVLELNNQPAASVFIEVRYTATIAEAVNISLGVLKLVADAYENRTEQSIESLTRVKMNAAKYFREQLSGKDLF